MGTRVAGAVRIGLVSVSLAALLSGGLSAPAYADPDAVAKARERVEALTMEASELDQQAVQAEDDLAAARARLAAREGELSAQSVEVERIRSQVGQVALAQFRGRDVDPATQIFLRSDSEGFLSQYATMQQVNAKQHEVLQNFQEEQANLADLQRAAAADVVAVDASARKVHQARRDSELRVQEAQRVLDRLTEEERRRLEAERAREEAEARAAAERAAAEAAADAQPPTSDAAPASDSPAAGSSAAPVPAGGRAGASIAYAKAQLGKPYGYGATGPDAFDCSGLTMQAYRAAGVSLSRTTFTQVAEGARIPLGQLQPGDLVFYDSIGHVGLYVGNGQVIHAPHTGAVVRYASLNGFGFGVRVG